MLTMFDNVAVVNVVDEGREKDSCHRRADGRYGGKIVDAYDEHIDHTKHKNKENTKTSQNIKNKT